ncbi:MAG: Cell division protein FtsI [Peptidoglycan synthetase], partial [uncultured Rubrobacteraceae bacterium]
EHAAQADLLHLLGRVRRARRGHGLLAGLRQGGPDESPLQRSAIQARPGDAARRDLRRGRRDGAGAKREGRGQRVPSRLPRGRDLRERGRLLEQPFRGERDRDRPEQQPLRYKRARDPRRGDQPVLRRPGDRQQRHADPGPRAPARRLRAARREQHRPRSRRRLRPQDRRDPRPRHLPLLRPEYHRGGGLRAGIQRAGQPAPGPLHPGALPAGLGFQGHNVRGGSRGRGPADGQVRGRRDLRDPRLHRVQLPGQGLRRGHVRRGPGLLHKHSLLRDRGRQDRAGEARGDGPRVRLRRGLRGLPALRGAERPRAPARRLGPGEHGPDLLRPGPRGLERLRDGARGLHHSERRRHDAAAARARGPLLGRHHPGPAHATSPQRGPPRGDGPNPERHDAGGRGGRGAARGTDRGHAGRRQDRHRREPAGRAPLVVYLLRPGGRPRDSRGRHGRERRHHRRRRHRGDPRPHHRGQPHEDLPRPAGPRSPHPAARQPAGRTGWRRGRPGPRRRASCPAGTTRPARGAGRPLRAVPERGASAAATLPGGAAAAAGTGSGRM